MIDNKTYKVMHPDSNAFQKSSLELRSLLDPFPSSISHDATLGEETLILLPANVYGFYMKEKKWGECQTWTHN